MNVREAHLRAEDIQSRMNALAAISQDGTEESRRGLTFDEQAEYDDLETEIMHLQDKFGLDI